MKFLIGTCYYRYNNGKNYYNNIELRTNVEIDTNMDAHLNVCYKIWENRVSFMEYIKFFDNLTYTAIRFACWKTSLISHLYCTNFIMIAHQSDIVKSLNIRKFSRKCLFMHAIIRKHINRELLTLSLESGNIQSILFT